jgi:hypothetical protein
MQMGLSIPFENATRRFRQDTGYALFRLAYWATVLSAARKRRKVYKAPMEPVVRRGESVVEIPFPRHLSGDFIPLH